MKRRLLSILTSALISLFSTSEASNPTFSENIPHYSVGNNAGFVVEKVPMTSIRYALSEEIQSNAGPCALKGENWNPPLPMFYRSFDDKHHLYFAITDSVEAIGSRSLSDVVAISSNSSNVHEQFFRGLERFVNFPVKKEIIYQEKHFVYKNIKFLPVVLGSNGVPDSTIFNAMDYSRDFYLRESGIYLHLPSRIHCVKPGSTITKEDCEERLSQYLEIKEMMGFSGSQRYHRYIYFTQNDSLDLGGASPMYSFAYINPSDGVNLGSVVVHELGHLIGADHTLAVGDYMNWAYTNEDHSMSGVNLERIAFFKRALPSRF